MRFDRLQMLLNLQHATREHAASWAVLVRVVAEAEGRPEWWLDAAPRITDLAPLDVPGALERVLRDLGDDYYDDEAEE